MFAWSWMTLEWNLMCRSVNVEELHYCHISVFMDSFKIIFHKTKSNQSGDGPANEKHIFANPYRPESCCVLALAVYELSKSIVINTSTNNNNNNNEIDDNIDRKLFHGSNQKSRFSEILHTVLDDMLTENPTINLGCGIDDISTHSIRKSVITYAHSILHGPSDSNIKFRSNHSNGMDDIYNLGSEGGDQYTGRCVALLNPINSKFGVIMPHFSNKGAELLNNEVLNQIYPGNYYKI